MTSPKRSRCPPLQRVSGICCSACPTSNCAWLRAPGAKGVVRQQGLPTPPIVAVDRQDRMRHARVADLHADGRLRAGAQLQQPAGGLVPLEPAAGLRQRRCGPKPTPGRPAAMPTS
jgi:hypothetical protein